MQHQRSDPAKLERIALTGFMGAGKSSVGLLLAARIGWRFFDADRQIESEIGLTISDIFRRHGEAFFRASEAEIIGKLSSESRTILALGGGALETPSTLSLLLGSPATCIIFLDAPSETLLERCRQQQASASSERADASETAGLESAVVRPLLAELQNDPGRFEQKLAARLPQYRKAHLTVSTANATTEEVADQILSRIAAFGIDLRAGTRTP